MIEEEDDLTDPPERLKSVQDSFVPSEDQQNLLDDTLTVFFYGNLEVQMWFSLVLK